MIGDFFTARVYEGGGRFREKPYIKRIYPRISVS